MRLRRENGDFQIKITTSPEGDNPPAIDTIKPGLGIEDLIGELVLIQMIGEVENEETGELEAVEVDGVCQVTTVYEVPGNSSLLALDIPSTELLPPIEIAYDKETGELSVANFAGSHVAPGTFTPVEDIIGGSPQEIT